MEDINLPFFRELGTLLEGIVEQSEAKYAQQKQKIYDEFKSIKEELHRLEDALKEEELNLNAFMNFETLHKPKKELKKLWKEASKLCHPDLVQEEYKVEASRTMQKLNAYYSDGNLEAIQNILNRLKKGNL